MRGQKVYKRILDSLMSSVHRLGPGQQYEYNRVYTEAEKRQVTPEELLRWLNMRTFGVPDPAPDTMIRPLAVLWLVYSSVACDFISATDRDRVKADLADTGTVILDGQNPIAKVPIIVSGNQGTVFIDEIQGCRILTVSLLVLITTMWMTMEEHCKDSMRRLNMRFWRTTKSVAINFRTGCCKLQSGFMSLRRENVELRSEIAGIMQAMERVFKL
ncbi:hypothetical protein MHU86_6331 [Fragilaria crotonensis]|nr:hypothetical protein MHU86_6331 [Fragilaria crotonensis]